MEISLNGTIYKYTNFLFGYQERYFKINNGKIYYYLSKKLEKNGCRKFKSLTNFSLNFYDDNLYRFDIVFSDEKWPLKFRTKNEFVLWRNALQAFLIEKIAIKDQIFSSLQNTTSSSNYALECNSNGSEVSISKSVNSKTTLNQKDLEQLKTNMPKKLNVIINVLDRTIQLANDNNLKINLEVNDNYALTDLNLALNNCYQLKNDVVYVKNFLKTISFNAKLTQKPQKNHQIENNKKINIIENNNNTLTKQNDNNNQILTIKNNENSENSDEWEDAIDEYLPINFNKQTNALNTLNKPFENGANKKPIINDSIQMSLNNEKKNELINNSDTEEKLLIELKRDDGFTNLFSIELINKNKIFVEIAEIAWKQLNHALAPVDNRLWELFYSDKEINLYRIEKEVEDKIVCDPIKAIHSVSGVSAKEYIDIFYDPNLKMEWDDTLVKMKIIEVLTENTCILHQVHKRIWPSHQRESLFWSQRIDVSAYKDSNAIDAFIVCNHDVKLDDVPLNDPSAIRVKLTIAMLCQTIITNNSKTISDSLTRDDICCKITYIAQVHPGGWVPTAVLRQLYKSEYPKFLKQFKSYVIKKINSKPLEEFDFLLKSKLIKL